MQVRHCANPPLAVSSRVESVTVTSLAKEFIKTSTTILMPPEFSCTEYVSLNPIVTTEVKEEKLIFFLSRNVCKLSTKNSWE